MMFNDGLHIKSVLDASPCKKHKAPVGSPCWHIKKGFGHGYLAAACSNRIRKAGFKGKISMTSVQVKKMKAPRSFAR